MAGSSPRAKRRKMVRASQAIDKLRSEAGPGRWSGAREIRKWRDKNTTTADLAGSGAKKARLSEMKHLLDRMRAEDA